MQGRGSRLVSNALFRSLLLAHALATLAQLQLTMAVGVDALARTGTGVWVSVAVALGFLPYLLCSIPAGALVDTYRRTTVLRVSIGLRVLTAGAVAAGMLLQWPVPLVVALAAATAVLATPTYPAVVAATPQAVAADDLGPANTLVTGVENAAWVAGPGLLGLVLLLGAPPAGGAVAAVAFLLVALLCLGRAATPMPTRPGGADGHDDWLLAGLASVRSHRPIRLTFILAGLDNFVYGYLVVAVILVSHTHLGTGERGAGWLNAALTAGALASMLVTWRLDYQRQARAILVVGLVASAALMALIGSSQWLPMAMLLVLLAGIAQLVVEIVAVTLIQDTAPPHLMGRIFGVYDALAVGLIALGSALAGSLADAVGVSGSMLLVGLAIALLALLPGRRLLRLPANEVSRMAAESV